MAIGRIKLSLTQPKLPDRLSGIPWINIASGFGDEIQRAVSNYCPDDHGGSEPPASLVFLRQVVY